MRPRIVRSPVDICFGTRPSQAAKSRPRVKAVPLPIAATTALEMIGPIPGIVIKCRQGCVFLESASWDTKSARIVAFLCVVEHSRRGRTQHAALLPLVGT